MIRFTLVTLSRASYGKSLPRLPDVQAIVMSRGDAPVTENDAAEILALTGPHDRAWIFLSNPRSGDYRAFWALPEDEDHRGFLLPHANAALSMPMRDEYLDYTFTVMWPTGQRTPVRYRDMIHNCTMAGKLMGGNCAWCPGCGSDGEVCRKTWLADYLTSCGFGPALGTLHASSSYDWSTPQDARSDANYGFGKHPHLGVRWLRQQHAHLRKRSSSVLQYVPAYHATRYPSAFVAWAQCRYRPSEIVLNAANVAENYRAASERAKRGAETRRRRNALCTGCTLRDSCAIFRAYDRCVRFTSDEDVFRYVSWFMSDNPQAVVPDTTIQRSLLLGGLDFFCANPETGRERRAEFGGFLDGEWVINMHTTRGRTGDYFTFSSWGIMRQFVRRWAPETLRILDNVEANAPNIPMTDYRRALFSLCSSLRWITYRAGFGNVTRRVSVISATGDLTAAEASIRYRLGLDDNWHYRHVRSLAEFLRDYKWTSPSWHSDILPPPSHAPERFFAGNAMADRVSVYTPRN